MARGTKTAVTAYERRRWLEELEKGKGITEIARETKRDIRVVKRHIEIAEQERETTQVRHDFLLGRLERHQEDLLAEVERLRKELLSTLIPLLEPGDPLQQKYYAALKEHLHRFPVGKSLADCSGFLQEYRNMLRRINQDLAAQEARLVSNLSPKAALVNWTGRIILILEQGNLGEQTYDAGEKADQSYQPSWASFYLTRSAISQGDLKAILKAHRLLVAKAEEASVPIREQRCKIIAAIPHITEELSILLVKQFIPGHCQYCPL